MSWTATLTAGTTSASGGPFPPDYNVGAVGYVIAASNPTGDSTGTLSGDGAYLDIIIAAMAYNAASPNATQFMVALEGSYDQAFLGNVTFTDAAGPQTYLSADANFIQQTVAGQALTLWIWPATGYFDSTDAYTINISDTTDTPIVLSGAAVSSTEIQLAFNDQTVGAAEIYQLWGAANSSTLSLIRSGIVPGSMPMDLTLTALAANTQYTYQVVGVIDGATEILSSTGTVGGGENWGEASAVGFSTATSGSYGSMSPAIFNGNGLLFLGDVTYDFAHYLMLILPAGTPQNYFTSVTIGGNTYQSSAASYDNSGTPLGEALSGFGSEPCSWLWVTSNVDFTSSETSNVEFAGAFESYDSNIIEVWTPASGISNTFNCDCEAIPAIPTNQTLGTLRQRLAARLGYAAQASNLPPGAVVLFNEFLTSAQNQVYRFFLDKRISRYWAWQMEIDQRYYNFNQNESGCRSIDSLKVEWVGFEDLNLAWYPLINGIDPVMYTRAQISTGWPTHYEIRSCIEIFPAPKQQYTLWIKGGIQLDPFVADDDYATMDSELVLMLALGLGKTHYGQPDASSCMTQAANYMSKIVAGLHGTRRYVPRTKTNTLLTPPLFLPTIEPGSSS